MKATKVLLLSTSILFICFSLAACGKKEDKSEHDTTAASGQVSVVSKTEDISEDTTEDLTGVTTEDKTEDKKEDSEATVTEFMSYEEQLAINEIITIRLEENMSTGFSWQYVIEDESVLRLESDGTFEEDSQSDGIEGQSSQHEWNIKAVFPGTTKITFIYSKSGSNEPAAKKVEYTITVNEDSTPFEAVSEPYLSEDQSKSAQIIQVEGKDNKTLRISDKDVVIADIPVEEDMVAQILSVDWLNHNKLLGITSHINPSMNLYTLVELDPYRECVTYYGFSFTWNSDWSNMYYIQAAPHFSEDTVDVLMDKNGTIIYQTQGGDRFAGLLIVSEDGKFIACEVAKADGSIELMIFEKKDGEIYSFEYNLIDYIGIPSFSDNETITVLTDDGHIKEYKIRDQY